MTPAPWLGILVGIAALAIRWRFPVVPRPLATFVAGSSLASAAWVQLLPRLSMTLAALGIVTVGALAALVDCFFLVRRKRLSADGSAPYRGTAFIRADGAGPIDLEDVDSNAETFIEGKSLKSIKARRINHVAASGGDPDGAE